MGSACWSSPAGAVDAQLQLSLYFEDVPLRLLFLLHYADHTLSVHRVIVIIVMRVEKSRVEEKGRKERGERRRSVEEREEK